MEFKTIINLILVFFVTNSVCYKKISEENSLLSIEKNFLDTFDDPTGKPPTTDEPSINTGWTQHPPPTTDISPDFTTPDPDGTTPTQSTDPDGTTDDPTTESQESTPPPDSDTEHEWFIVSMVFIPAAVASSSVVLFLMCTMKETVPTIGFIAPIVTIPRV